MQASVKHAYPCPVTRNNLLSFRLQPVSSLKPGRAVAFHSNMNRRQSSKALMETYKRAVQGNKESLEEADMPSSRQVFASKQVSHCASSFSSALMTSALQAPGLSM